MVSLTIVHVLDDAFIRSCFKPPNQPKCRGPWHDLHRQRRRQLSYHLARCVLVGATQLEAGCSIYHRNWMVVSNSCSMFNHTSGWWFLIDWSFWMVQLNTNQEMFGIGRNVVTGWEDMRRRWHMANKGVTQSKWLRKRSIQVFVMDIMNGSFCNILNDLCSPQNCLGQALWTTLFFELFDDHPIISTIVLILIIGRLTNPEASLACIYHH